METIISKNKESISQKEKEIIFEQFIDDFVIEKNNRKLKEKEVLLEKIRLHTEGKNVVLENTTI